MTILLNSDAFILHNYIQHAITIHNDIAFFSMNQLTVLLFVLVSFWS